ncbi:MAG: TrmB family transcriptional regulator [Haloarculaceae archaeon]
MSDAAELFDRLDLSEYERTALAELLTLGRTTAPNLAEAAGIPKARIYGVLDALADRGFVEVIPGRPKEYKPKAPAEILDRAAENRRQELERFHRDIGELREDFLAEFQPRYERAHNEVTPAEELFHVVDVGEPSETETRRLYHEADERVDVITNSFAYFEAVEPAVADALERVTVDVLFLHPDLLAEEKRPVQSDTVAYIRSEYPDVGVRFSTDRLPWRGTLVDPSMDYDTGEAIFLVEEPDVPNHMRQAAITENGSMVAGLKRYFDLVWDHESVASVR